MQLLTSRDGGTSATQNERSQMDWWTVEAPTWDYVHNGIDTSSTPPHPAATIQWQINKLHMTGHLTLQYTVSDIKVDCTYRFSNAGDCWDGEPKQVLSLQIDGEESQHARLSPPLSHGPKNLVPDS